ncbi:MAG: hypothetical protein AB7F50_00355 [Fimbriimonadaceae bacterium]
MGHDRHDDAEVSAPRYFETFGGKKLRLHDAVVDRIVIEGGQQRPDPDDDSLAHMDWHLTGFEFVHKEDPTETHFRSILRFHNVKGIIAPEMTGEWIYEFDYVVENRGLIRIQFNYGPDFEDFVFWCSRIEELEFEAHVANADARSIYRPGEVSPVPTAEPET